MNNSELWAQGFECYEQFNIVDDMNDFMSWAQASSAMNSSGLWITWMTPDRELKALDAMNS